MRRKKRRHINEEGEVAEERGSGWAQASAQRRGFPSPEPPVRPSALEQRRVD